MADTDALLLRRFCDTADPKAFSEIVKLYAGVIYGACRRITHDSELAKDVAQETFFQLMRNAGDVSGSLAGWLHTVATRKAINVVQKDSARKKRESEYCGTNLQEAESWDEVSPYVDEALGQIDDQLRQVLVKHFLEGLTTRQLAEEIGVSQATISRRVNAGLDSVRAVLKKRGIIIAAISLSGLMAQNAAQAAPAVLVAELGKMSLVTGGTTVAGTIATAMTTIKAKIIAAVAIVAISTGAVITYSDVTNPPAEVSMGAATPQVETTWRAEGRKVLHFPADLSLGSLKVQNEGTKRQIDIHFREPGMDGWDYLAEARGRVVIPKGKRVQLEINKPLINGRSPLSSLRKDDLYMLSVRILSPKIKVNDALMPQISHLTGLKRLSLSQAAVTNRGIRHLTEMKSLEVLSLPSGVSNAGIKYLKGLRSLNALYLPGCRIDDRGLARLVETTQLKDVYFHLGPKAYIQGLNKIAKLPTLNYHVYISDRLSKDRFLKQLQNAVSLVSLHIPNTTIADTSLSYLSNLSKLESLGLFNNENITDGGLALLKKMPSLKKLNIAELSSRNPSNITDNGMKHLAEIKTLESIRFPETITDRGLGYLTGLKKIKELYLWGNVNSKSTRYYTHASLEHISNFHELEVLDIRPVEGLDSDGLSCITQLTNLKELTILGKFGGAAPVIKKAEFAKLTSLEYLSINNIFVSATADINKLTRLKYLSILGLNKDDSILDISALRNLEKLYLNFPALPGSFIQDEDLACLTQLHNLKTFGVSGDFTDMGLQHLEGLKALKWLSIVSENNFNPKALRRLKASLPAMPPNGIKTKTF